MANRATAAAGPVAKRSSPRARTAAARAAAQAALIPAVEPPVAAAAAAAVAAVQSEQKVDEAQVQAAFGAHAHHSSANDSVADLSLPVATTATSMPIVSTAATAAVTTMPSDTVSLQALAQQQDEYQRKLKQLQQQHELQQQQWQMRQQAALQQQKMQLEQAERQDRMHQIQQKLHERIQLKQMHGSSGSPSLVASPGAAGQTQATQQLRQAIIHREEKEMAQSLAEQQMQLYKAMVRDLEMQSGIPMTPMPSPAIPGGTGGFGAELVPAPILSGTMALDVSTTKAYEDFQRARQEQQLRLQQYQHIQHASTTGGGGGSPSVVRTQSVSASNDLVRQQMMIEQERLRVLQAQEMHQQQQQQVVHSREPQVSAQEQLLSQQHDILRQQQILQTLLQRQQFERQQQTATARSQQPQQQKVSTAKKTAAAASSASTSASPGEGALPPPPAKKRKKTATSPESQMESLVRELIRLSNAGNAIEMRTSLDKMTAWVHRSFDAELLKFAQRDFRDIVLAKRPSLMQANQWTSDIQVKCEYIIEKIAQVVMAVSVQHPGKATEGVTLTTTTTTTSSTDQANAIRLAAKEHAYAALKAQMTQQQQQKGKGGGAAAKAFAQLANISSSATTTDEKKPKQPLLVDLSLIDPKQKAAALSANVEPKSEALMSTEGAGQALAAAAMSATTTTPSAASMSTKAAKATPSVPKNVSLSTPLPSAPATATPLSPQLVQQLYEVDLTSRSCTVNEEEGEDKLYIPVKSIAKVMRRALPDDHGSSSSQVTAKGSGMKSSGSIDVADVAVKTEHSSTVAQGATDGVKEIKENDGDEEMKTGGDGDEEEESKPSSSSTPVASISLAALALQKRQELVERNLQQSGQAPIKIDDDAAAFMQECVTEFILYLTSEAKDHWSIDKKKTNSLLGTHVVQGMDNLGFSTYARVLDTFNAKIKKVQDTQTQKRVEKKLQDKKLKQQQKLLEVAEAKARAAAAKVAVDAAASASTAEAGSVTIRVVATAVTSATPDVGAASEASAATTVTTTTTTTSSTHHELELMAREDLSTTQ